MPDDAASTAFRAFALRDGSGGVPVRVRAGDADPHPPEGVTIALAVDGTPAFRVGERALAFSAAGALALAAREAGGGAEARVRAPRVAFSNYAQPAFAARAVTLDPRELDTRAFPAAVDVGLPFLVVPVASAGALARAEFAQWRVDDLMPRVGARAVAAFAERADGVLAVRAFADALGLPEPFAFGDAALAVAAWRVDALGERVDARVEAGAPRARTAGRVRAEKRGDGIVAEVEGRVTHEA